MATCARIFDNNDDDKVKSESQYLEKIADDLVVTGSVPLCQHSSQHQPDQRADIITAKNSSLQCTTSACWHYERNNWNLIWKHADIIDNSSQKINTSLQCKMWIYDKSHQPTLLSPSQLLSTNNLPPLLSAPFDHSGVVRRVVIVVGDLVTTILIIILPSLSLSSGYNLWKLKTESGEDCAITVLHCFKVENKQLKM